VNKMGQFKKTNLVLRGLDMGYAPFKVYKKDSHYYLKGEGGMVRFSKREYKENIRRAK